eukprot:1622089-Rhodomonas_salina.1
MAVEAARMRGVSHMHLLCLHWGCRPVHLCGLAHVALCISVALRMHRLPASDTGIDWPTGV